MAERSTIRASLDGATRTLAAAGLLRPRDEALYLLAHLLGIDRGAVLVRAEDPLAADLERQFRRWIERRAAREPAQHLTGSQGFHGLELSVDRRALVPRPETEGLVDAVLDAGLGRRARVVDLGTGSGCVAIALATSRPDWRVTALDRSDEALALARINIRRYELESRVEALAGDMLQPPVEWRERYDVVVSNPPYVGEAEWAALEPEFREHDPREALVAGPRGDELLLQLVPVARDLLRPGGFVAFEVGAGQAPTVEDALRDAGFVRTARLTDLRGIERVVTGWNDAAEEAR